jgi:integrase
MLINFKKSTLESLIPPSKGRSYYHDEKEKGLSAYLTTNGVLTFYTRKRVSGRDVRMTIGVYPDVSIEQARRKSVELKGLVASGVDPNEQKRKIKINNKTFEELYVEYMERYSKKHKRSWKYDEREVNKFLSHWFKRKLSDIKKTEVQLLIEKIHDTNGLYQANRILERVRAMYNKAIEWGWEGINPAIGIKKYKEKSRDRFILPNEMPHLVRALEEEENITARDYFWMLLLTGARRTNTLTMQWIDINWEMCIWRIPVTKNGDPVTVPLVEKAVNILKGRKAKSESDWVFPSQEDPTKHLVNFKRAWKRTQQKATLYLLSQDVQYSKLIFEVDLNANGYDQVNLAYKRVLARAAKTKITLPTGLMDVHIHDIRRTFGSFQAITGASLQVIGKSLGHKSPLSTQVYARLNLDPVRASIEKATQVMFG